MSPRASPVKRTRTPLAPAAMVLAVLDSVVIELEPKKVTPESVGLKAFGLASLPVAWTQPFFVIPQDSFPRISALQNVLARLEIPADSKLILRSSGEDESMYRRGDLESAECDLSTLITELSRLRNVLQARHTKSGRQVHWVVQQLLTTRAKGHLSNERRIAEDKRDWVAEVEASASYPVDAKPISLRTWRDNRLPREDTLSCQYRQQYTQCLTNVARWAYERLIRVHFE